MRNLLSKLELHHVAIPTMLIFVLWLCLVYLPNETREEKEMLISEVSDHLDNTWEHSYNISEQSSSALTVVFYSDKKKYVAKKNYSNNDIVIEIKQ